MSHYHCEYGLHQLTKCILSFSHLYCGAFLANLGVIHSIRFEQCYKCLCYGLLVLPLWSVNGWSCQFQPSAFFCLTLGLNFV